MQYVATRFENARSGWRFSLPLLFMAAILLAFCPQATAQQALPEIGEGCLLYRSPVSGQYEVVPLVHTDAVLDVRGMVAAATVTQRYVNSTSTPVEAIYVFPLPHDAAVYDMEIHVGNRVIRSVIRERAEAKRVYEAAKAEGKRAALLEQERPNIFTASVANIMPGDHIDVQLRYVQTLEWEEGSLRLTFPMVVGPRYIPGTEATGHSGTGWSSDTDAVPDASRITPTVRNPDSRPGHDISVTVDLDRQLADAAIKGVSHEVTAHRLSDGRARVRLASATVLPNRDFVLEIRPARSVLPKTALFLSPSGEGTHFLLAAFPPTVQSGPRTPVEMLYMIDVSGSMEGTSIEQAREALLQALDRLRPGDRFDILAFNSGYREFSAEPVAATSENLDEARAWVRALNAEAGTEMLPALTHLMRKPRTDGYLRHIVLLTDGDLGNEEQVFDAVRQHLGDARLFTVAIGSAPNHFLATKMAQFGRGTFTHIADVKEVRERMTRLFGTIENPVLTDVKLSFDDVQVADLYPERAPDLFQGRPLLISGRITKGSAGRVWITAASAGGPYAVNIPFDVSRATFHPGVTTLWARQQVDSLTDQWRLADNSGQADIRSKIVEQAIRYRLVTQFTSLVAVEQVIANPGGQSNTVPVPTELPAGWQMESVFGAPATGTVDEFLAWLGLVLLVSGALFFWISRKKGALA